MCLFLPLTLFSGGCFSFSSSFSSFNSFCILASVGFFAMKLAWERGQQAIVNCGVRSNNYAYTNEWAIPIVWRCAWACAGAPVDIWHFNVWNVVTYLFVCLFVCVCVCACIMHRVLFNTWTIFFLSFPHSNSSDMSVWVTECICCYNQGYFSFYILFVMWAGASARAHVVNVYRKPYSNKKS